MKTHLLSLNHWCLTPEGLFNLASHPNLSRYMCSFLLGKSDLVLNLGDLCQLYVLGLGFGCSILLLLLLLLSCNIGRTSTELGEVDKARVVGCSGFLRSRVHIGDRELGLVVRGFCL